MPEPTLQPGKLHFFDLNEQALQEALVKWGWPLYRATQLYDWVYRKSVTNPLEMSTFSRADRLLLAERMLFDQAQVERQQTSADGTVKMLLRWPDGRQAETVMIPDRDRRTACISSQVGCPVGCRFCASGLSGVQGNLSPGQITEQVFALNRILRPRGEQISNVVFMGMGEPLANYANVVAAVRLLHGPQQFNLGARRITISTVGVPSRIRDLADEGLAVNLALSLHAPNETLRRQLIPWAEHFALDEILEAVGYYFRKTGREVTLEYILLHEVNDQPQHARELLALCRRLRANVNLIRYNEVEGLAYRRPESKDAIRFQEILRKGGINVHVRRSRGRDIDAACGQLRRREQGERSVELGLPARQETR